MALALVISSVCVAAMIILFSVLGHERHTGQRAIRAYVRQIRQGQTVAVSVGGSESTALTEWLGHSSGLSFGNFQGQANTQCYWTSIRTGGVSREVRFLLHGDSPRVVIGVSANRECNCPDPDFDAPCRLE